MKSLDSKWFNLQLFRFINGINVSNIEDARLIQEKLNSGQLNTSMFYLTGGWGDVTAYRSKLNITMAAFTGVFMIVAGSYVWHLQAPIVSGYSKIPYRDSIVYLSTERVIIGNKEDLPNEAYAFTKNFCKEKLNEIQKDTILHFACSNLARLDELEEYRLNMEIKNTAEIKKNLEILYRIYCAVGTILLYSLIRFVKINRKVRSIKFENHRLNGEKN